MNMTGYIKYNNNDYTFHYKDDFLTLIIVDQNKETDRNLYIFNRTEKVKYLSGWTSDGFAISFYVDGDVNKWNGTVRCFPKIVIYSEYQNFDLFKKNIKSIKFRGGIINRFYSNRNIFESKCLDILENKSIKFKNLEDVTLSEKITIDRKQAIFQISVAYPGWKDDGSITLGDIPSIIRIIYKKNYNYEELIQSILNVNDLMFFCMNRRIFKFEDICLEITNLEGKFIEVAKIYVPNKTENEVPKYMLNYMFISGKISKLLKCLDKVGYLTYKIPKDNKDFVSISATSYSNAFSAFQSIYNYVYTTKDMVYDNEDFKDVKKEICDALQEVENKYKGVNSKKRKFVERYSELVKKSNLKLEQMIINTIKEYEFVIDTLPDQEYKQAMLDYESVVIEAVKDRDLITHNDVFAPNQTDMAVYLVLERLCYAMVFRKIGIGKKKIKQIIHDLSVRKVI